MHGPHVTPPAPAPVAPPAPRQVAPARPAAPTPKPGPRPEEGNGLRVFTYLKLHWMTILFCGTLIGGAGAFAAWEVLSSKYESYGLFQVSSVPSTIANGGNREQARTDFVTYLKTTSALIKSEFVLNAALRDIKDLPTIKAQRDPIKFLEDELVVTWQDGSEVIRVSCKSHEPADAKKIVDAVQAAFMKEVIQQETLARGELHRQVQKAQLEMKQIVERLAGNNDSRKVVNAVTGPGEGGGPPKELPGVMPSPLPPLAPAVGVGQPNPGGVQAVAAWDAVTRIDPRILVSHAAGLIQEARRLPLTINDGKRHLALLQKKLDTIRDAPVSPATLEATEKDQDVIVQILKTKSAERDYEFRKNAGDANAPGVVQLKKAWEAHQERLAAIRKEKATALEGTRRVAEGEKVAAEMQDLIRGLQRQQEQLDLVKAELAKAEKQLAEIPAPTEKGGGIVQIGGREPAPYSPESSATDMTDSVYRRLVQQFYVTQMELNSPPRVRVLQAGSNPTQREMKKQVMGTVFAGLTGFGLMVLGVVAFETLAKRVSSLTDVKAATPLPIVGVVPCLPSDATGRAPATRAAANEAIDKLRAHVAQAWLARGATTVAVTSALGDEGKAFAAFGLASSLAQSGYKTLLVDFDLRDPQLHDLAGVPNAAGVCELLRAETDPRSALQFLPSGLHLLPAGKWSDEARKAATGERLEALLSGLKGPYDCVVMHGHALLTAAESVAVARQCEVVLVCAQYRETTMPLLRKAAERVAAMEIPYAGVVYVGATAQESLC